MACTMFGAVIAWFTVLHAPGNALIPAALLGVLIAVGSREYSRLRSL